jgi:hypothetical protein
MLHRTRRVSANWRRVNSRLRRIILTGSWNTRCGNRLTPVRRPVHLVLHRGEKTQRRFFARVVVNARRVEFPAPDDDIEVIELRRVVLPVGGSC